MKEAGAYLKRHKGRRPRKPESTHGALPAVWFEKYKDNWSLIERRLSGNCTRLWHNRTGARRRTCEAGTGSSRFAAVHIATRPLPRLPLSPRSEKPADSPWLSWTQRWTV